MHVLDVTGFESSCSIDAASDIRHACGMTRLRRILEFCKLMTALATSVIPCLCHKVFSNHVIVSYIETIKDKVSRWC